MSLKKNTLWNLAGSAVPLLAAVLLIPYMLRQLGHEAFGVLTLIWGLIGYFSLFDMGVGRALTYQLSRLQSSGQTAEIGPTLKAGVLLTVMAGFLGVAVVASMAHGLSSSWLKIGPALQEDTFFSFLIAAGGILPTTLASGLRGAMEGFDDFAASNLSRMALGILMFVLPAWVVFAHGPWLWLITLYLVAGRVLVVLGLLWQIKARWPRFDTVMQLRHVKSLWTYGFWVTVTGVIGPLMVYGDRFFVSAVVGPEQLPLYAIPQEGLLRLLMIPAALTGAILPRLAALDAAASMQLFRRSYAKVAAVMLVVCATAAALAYPALTLWLSVAFATAAWPIAVVLCLGIWLNSVALVPYTFLHSRGNPRLTAIFHLFELFIYLLVLWLLTDKFGLLGAAVAWVVRVLIDLLLLDQAARKYVK